VPARSAALRAALQPLAGHRHVREVRLTGLMGGIELVADRESGQTFAPGERVGHRVGLAMRTRGVFARPLGDVMVLMPPLTSTHDELKMLAGVLHAAILEVLGP
jgi:adenosylmethionine-8-amino-7-oxononanoate aminotransferase